MCRRELERDDNAVFADLGGEGVVAICQSMGVHGSRFDFGTNGNCQVSECTFFGKKILAKMW